MGRRLQVKEKSLDFLGTTSLLLINPYLAQCRANSVHPLFSPFLLPLQTVGAKSNDVPNDSCTRLKGR